MSLLKMSLLGKARRLEGGGSDLPKKKKEKPLPPEDSKRSDSDWKKVSRGTLRLCPEVSLTLQDLQSLFKEGSSGRIYCKRKTGDRLPKFYRINEIFQDEEQKVSSNKGLRKVPPAGAITTSKHVFVTGKREAQPISTKPPKKK